LCIFKSQTLYCVMQYSSIGYDCIGAKIVHICHTAPRPHLQAFCMSLFLTVFNYLSTSDGCATTYFLKLLVESSLAQGSSLAGTHVPPIGFNGNLNLSGDSSSHFARYNPFKSGSFIPLQSVLCPFSDHPTC